MPFVILALLYVISAVVIGFLGRNYRFGFWGFFFATLLLSPLMGVLLLAAAGGKREHT